MTIQASFDPCSAVHWDERGLAPAIVQDARSGRVLMLAWMNRESLRLTVQEQRAVFWSRSRGTLWRKGETSGHVQHVRDIQLDCDGDTLLIRVEQAGGIACHTGRHSCFYRRLGDDGWQEAEPVLRDPQAIYGTGNE